MLCHITSLPGPYGIGDLGETALEFIGELHRAGQHVWEILSLGHSAGHNSPYNCYSAFAGNPLLISPSGLVADGLLETSDLGEVPSFAEDCVDYEVAWAFKKSILQRSFDHFRRNATSAQREDFRAFCHENAWWLDDYALFTVLVEVLDQADWSRWDRELAERRPEAVRRSTQEYSRSLDRVKYVQYVFFSQWQAVRELARQKDVWILGDLPFFVAHASADVWVNRDCFLLDEAGNPTVVAGVPPDYFSTTGQLWHNPHYCWKRIDERGYDWWIQRMRHAMSLYDFVRIDHFRGFEACWHVPAGAPDASRGQWVKGPGTALFRVLTDRLGELPIVAEDLGTITPEVHQLRDELGFPGMRVLQFGFSPGSGSGTYHRPEEFPRNCVVFTGTHDNDTSLGWFENCIEGRQANDELLRYLGTDGREIHWDLIELAWSSAANMAIAPLQDVLGLGSAARMNNPEQAEGNWTWRFTREMLTAEIMDRLRQLTEQHGRSQ